jgi:hypothetical protein
MGQRGGRGAAPGDPNAVSVQADVPANAAQITVTSPTLKNGEAMPKQHTPDGRNDSPAIAWTGIPMNAKELIVLCEDPDAGAPPPYVHWVVYKIPATATGLPEAMPLEAATPMPAGLTGTLQGTNGFRRALYRGPAPPAGAPHHYHFIVYALDAPIEQKPYTPPMTRADLLDAAKRHIIGKGEIVVTYERH